MDSSGIDRELVAAFNELIEAVHEAMQAAWRAGRGPTHDALSDLIVFLRAQASAVADAEAAIDGRSPDMVSPSEQPSRNLVADALDGGEEVIPLLIDRLRLAEAALRSSAERVKGSEVANLLFEAADGLRLRIGHLAFADRRRTPERGIDHQ